HVVGVGQVGGQGAVVAPGHLTQLREPVAGGRVVEAVGLLGGDRGEDAGDTGGSGHAVSFESCSGRGGAGGGERRVRVSRASSPAIPPGAGEPAGGGRWPGSRPW